MEKPTKEEFKALLEEYGTARQESGYHEATLDRAAKRRYDTAAKEASDRIIDTLCADDEDGVEWIARDSKERPLFSQMIYAGSKDQVIVTTYHGAFPSWCTHWAPAPPRKLPKPPKQEAPADVTS